MPSLPSATPYLPHLQNGGFKMNRDTYSVPQSHELNITLNGTLRSSQIKMHKVCKFMQAISFEDVETKHILNHYSSNFPIKALKKRKSILLPRLGAKPQFWSQLCSNLLCDLNQVTSIPRNFILSTDLHDKMPFPL